MRRIIKKIKTATNIAVFCHTRPDPDALGSLFALVEGLKSIGKNAVAVLEDQTKNKFDFLNIPYTTSIPKNADLLIAVDVASKNLLGKFQEDFIMMDNIVIDHHAKRTAFAQTEYVDSTWASCAEIIFKLLKNLKVKITPRFATLIYAGIAGDTGCFLHSNTTAFTHLNVAELINLGADVSLVNRKLFKSNSKEKLKLIKFALDNMEIRKNYLLLTVSFQDYKNLGVNPEESLDIIDFISSVEGVDITALITEKKIGQVSVSLRCSDEYDVSLVAQKFGGGGHKCASGCKELKGNVEEVKEKIETEIKNM